jgi:hypothetical protein
MPVERRDEVTAVLVEQLWIEAIDGSASIDDVHRRAEALLDQVNAESPVVNWGLTTLHHLTRSPGRAQGDLVRARTAWLAEVERYEADPSAWMRRYFQGMIRDFTRLHGPEKGRAFAAKLVRDGHLREPDIPTEVRE